MRARFLFFFVLYAGLSACTSESPWVVPPHRPFPKVATTDGALLSPMSLVTIVSESDDAGTAEMFFEFSEQLGQSGWWQRIAPEYGLTTVTSAAELTGPPIDGDVTDHDVFEYITRTVSANGGPPKNGNTLYLLYLPVGTSVISHGVVNTKCKNFGGYHVLRISWR